MVKIGQKLHANMEGFRRAGHILKKILYHTIAIMGFSCGANFLKLPNDLVAGLLIVL